MLTLGVRPAGKYKQLLGQNMWKQLQGSAVVRKGETCSPGAFSYNRMCVVKNSAPLLLL